MALTGPGSAHTTRSLAPLVTAAPGVGATSAPTSVRNPAGYLPRLLNSVAPGGSQTQPVSTPMDAVVLFVDIVSFTATMERLSAHVGGTEQLRDALHAHFATVVQTVYAYGGDVLFFAGDALLALFPESASHAREALLLAVSSALRVQAATAASPFSVRIGIATGAVELALVGGHGGQWIFLADGPALEAAVGCESLAQPGEIVLAGRPDPAIGLCVVPRRAADHDEVYVVAAEQPDGVVFGPNSLVAVELAQRAYRDPPPTLDLDMMVPYPLCDPTADASSQLRSITAVFVRLGCGSGLTERHNAILAVQAACERHGGSLNKVLRDDKGLSALVAFGLPGRAGNACERGVQFALAIGRELSPFPDVGVATGTAYCGVFGPDERAEYAVLGDSVNVASRLMSIARGEVRTDKETDNLLVGSDRIQLESLGSVALKGKAAPIAVFRATLAIPSSSLPRRVSTGSSRSPSVSLTATTMLSRVRDLPLVGRAAEIQTLNGLVEGGAANCQAIIIRGDSGVGKSKVLRELAASAGAVAGVRALFTTCLIQDQSAPYSMWRPLLTTVMASLTASRSRLELRSLTKIVDLVESVGFDARDAALLKVFLPDAEIDQASSDWLRDLGEETRAVRTAKLTARLLDRVRGTGSLVVLIDDAHHADGPSLELLVLVAAALPEAQWVLTTDSDADTEQQLAPKLDGASRCVRLQGLSRDAMMELLRCLFEVGEVERDVAELIVSRSDGIPNNAVVIGTYLVENRFVVTAGNVAALSSRVSAEELQHAKFSVKSAALARFDALPRRQQIILRCAAVIGMRFDSASVERLCAVAGEPIGDVRAELSRLYMSDLIRIEGNSLGRKRMVCLFSQNSVREAAYDTMLVSLRRQLHQALGEALVEQLRDPDADDGDITNAQIARHFVESRDERAVEYSYRAAVDGRRARGYREALFWFARMEERLDDRQTATLGRRKSVRNVVTPLAPGDARGGRADRIARLRLLMGRGYCYERLGNFPASNAANMAFLDTAGAGLATSLPGRIAHLLGLLMHCRRMVAAWEKGQHFPRVARSARIRRWARWILDESGTEEERKEITEMAFHVLMAISTSAMHDADMIRDMTVSLRVFLLYEDLDFPTAQPFAMLSVVFGTLARSESRARLIVDRHAAHHKQLPLQARVDTCYVLPWVALIGGLFGRAREFVDEGITLASQHAAVGELRDLGGTSYILALLEGRAQDVIAAADLQYQQWTVARDQRARVWGLEGRTKAHVEAGDTAATARQLRELRELYDEDPAFFEEALLTHIEYRAVVSVAYAHTGEMLPAIANLRHLCELFRKSEPGQPNILWSLEQITLILRRECDRDGRFRRDAERLFKPIRKELARMTVLWFLAEPYRYFADALLRRGPPSRALLRKTVTAARAMHIVPVRLYAEGYLARLDADRDGLEATAKAFRDCGMTTAARMFEAGARN